MQAHSLQSGPLTLKKKLVIMLVINIFQVSCHSQVTEYGIPYIRLNILSSLYTATSYDMHRLDSLEKIYDGYT